MKKTLTLMICGALFLFAGCFKCNAKPITLCLHTVKGNMTFDCNNLSESSPISDVLLSFCNIGSIELYFKENPLDPDKTFGEYQIHEGTIDVWASKQSATQSITNSNTNKEILLYPHGSPHIDIDSVRFINKMRNGGIITFDPLEKIHLNVCIYDSSVGSSVCHVTVDARNKIWNLSMALFKKRNVIFSRDGYILNPVSQFGNFGFKDGDTIYAFSYNPNEIIKPTIPMNWTKLSNLTDINRARLMFQGDFTSEKARLCDLRLRKFTCKAVKVRPLRRVGKRSEVNSQNDIQNTIIPLPSSQMGEDPLPIKWD